MTYKEKNVCRLPAKGMQLEATLFCGQSFSWHRLNNNTCQGIAQNHVIVAEQDKDEILLSAVSGRNLETDEIFFWENYFALNTNYAAIQKKFCENKKLEECVLYSPGIRILHQPFVETLFSFILSSSNNIKRIGGIVDLLRESFGEEIEKNVHGFPSAERLAGASLQDLGVLRAGYRDKYLLDAAQKVASGEINEADLRKLSSQKAREKLMRIHGVGEKVANCVLLFGLGRYEIAPVDRWIKRALAEVFDGNWPSEASGYEGIAQQYLFLWGRDNKIGTDKE